MKNAIVLVMVLCLSSTLTWAADTPVSFKDQVAPILVKRCLGCHSVKKAEAGLNLSNLSLLREGGEQFGTEIVVPSKPDESALVTLIRPDADPRMPFKQPALSAVEVGIIERWVREGAKYDGTSPTIEITKLFDPLTQLPKIALKTKIADPVGAAAFDSVNQRWVLGQGSSLLSIDDKTGSSQPIDATFPGQIHAILMSGEGEIIAAGGRSGMSGLVRVYQKDGKLVREIAAHRDAILDADFSKSAQLLATSSYDRTIKLWNISTGQEVRTLKEHTDAVYSVAFAPDGVHLASGSADRTVKVWSVASGKRLATLQESTAEVYAVAFGSDNLTVYAGGVDRAIRAWRFSENNWSLVASQLAHESPITGLVISPNGKFLVSGSEDRFVRIWDTVKLESTGALPSQSDWPHSIAIAQDGRILVGRHDGSAQTFQPNGQSAKVLISTPVQESKPAKTAPQPKLASKANLAPLSPRGGQRGKTVRMTLSGNGVGLADSVVFLSDGLSAKIDPNRQNAPLNQMVIDLTIAKDARIGLHQLLIPTPLGVTETRFFDVTADPETTEVEPNDSINQISKTTPWPTILTGAIDASGDEDLFRIDLKAGQAIVCETAASVMGSALKAELALLDGRGSPLVKTTFTQSQRDPTLVYMAKTDGPVYLRIADAELVGSGNHFYRITINTTPYIQEVFPLAVSAGGKTKIQIQGVNLGSITEQEIDAGHNSAGSTRSVSIHPQGAVRSAIGRSIVVGSGIQGVEQEPNDSLQQAKDLPIPGGLSGRIDTSEDSDWIKFKARKGESLVLEVTGRRLGSPIDSAIEIRDARGQIVPRVWLRPVAESNVAFRDHISLSPAIRLTRWSDLAINDYLLVGREVIRIFALPKNPDDDAVFWNSAGQRMGFFGTTPEQHPLDQKILKVEVYPAHVQPPKSGSAPVRIDYRNDDGDPGFDKDSMLVFDPPADGVYYAVVQDARGFGGHEYSYHFQIRHPQPRFEFSMNVENIAVPRGGTTMVTANVRRIDGFSDPIDVELDGLPPGIKATKARIDAHMTSADLQVSASIDAPSNAPPTWKAKASASKGQLVQNLDPGGARSGWISVIEPPDLKVWATSPQVTIKPGERVTAKFQIERGAAFKGRVPIEVKNLPHGVRVLNIGLNGVLITESQTEREVFIYAEPWVQPTERLLYAVGKVEANGTEHSSPPISLVVLPAK